MMSVSSSAEERKMTKLRLKNTAHKYSSTILHAKAKALFIDELGCDIASNIV
jgi:hypothetical protein